jgi:hypothetical protein
MCAVSSVVEHYLDTVGVRGSKPLSRTILSRFDAVLPLEERWLSGLKRRFAKPLYRVNWYRGFESLSLRHFMIHPMPPTVSCAFELLKLRQNVCSMYAFGGKSQYSATLFRKVQTMKKSVLTEKVPTAAAKQPGVIFEYITNDRRQKTLLITSPVPGQYALVDGKKSKRLTLIEAFRWIVKHDDPNLPNCFTVHTPNLRAVQAMFNSVADLAGKGGCSVKKGKTKTPPADHPQTNGAAFFDWLKSCPSAPSGVDVTGSMSLKLFLSEWMMLAEVAVREGRNMEGVIESLVSDSLDERVNQLRGMWGR